MASGPLVVCEPCPWVVVGSLFVVDDETRPLFEGALKEVGSELAPDPMGEEFAGEFPLGGGAPPEKMVPPTDSMDEAEPDPSL